MIKKTTPINGRYLQTNKLPNNNKLLCVKKEYYKEKGWRCGCCGYWLNYTITPDEHKGDCIERRLHKG